MKYIQFILVILFLPFCLSMNTSYHRLLNLEDLERVNSQTIPALSSTLDEKPYWESFNEWRCYPINNVQFECTGVDYYGLRYVPTIRISDGADLYDYSLDPEPTLDCGETLDKWKNLIEDQSSFCVYAAYLQDLPHESYEDEGIRYWSLWILEDIKTTRGYWKDMELDEAVPIPLEKY